MSNPITRRTWLAAATATVLALAIAPLGVCRADTLARVDVYDRSAGEALPVYRHHGRRYVVGEPGNEYAVRIRNCSGRRLLAVLSVDGVNAVTGESAAPDQAGYVLEPGGYVNIQGWRKDLSRTAAFYFSDPGDSYAARTGRPRDLGVIQTAEEFAEQVKGGHFSGGRFNVARFGGTVNEVVENQARIASYYAGIKQGLDPESAARLVDEALYDYSNVARTAFEQAVMMRAVPFYKWMRNNTPNMLVTLAKEPGKMAWLGHLKESGAAAVGEPENMPDWMRDLYPIATPLTNKDADPVLISTAGLFPQGELEILSGLLGGRIDPKDAFGSLSPILRTPLEVLFNRDLYYGQDISKYEGDKRRVPAAVEVAADAMSQVPGLSSVWGFVAGKLGIDERTTDDGTYWVAPAASVKVLRDLMPWYVWLMGSDSREVRGRVIECASGGNS